MSDLTTLPLDQLIQCCPPLTQPRSLEDDAAWDELQRRAVIERNDAAWDALVTRLWPTVLFWIYAQLPYIAPAAAEALIQQTIWCYRQQQLTHFAHSSPDTLPATLPFPATQLQRCLTQLLANRI